MTHPFHPLAGREFEVVTRRHTWSDSRVYYYGPGRELRSIPVAWTTLAPVDPFVQVAGGRCPFRVEDLLELLRLARGLPGAPPRT